VIGKNHTKRNSTTSGRREHCRKQKRCRVVGPLGETFPGGRERGPKGTAGKYLPGGEIMKVA